MRCSDLTCAAVSSSVCATASALSPGKCSASAAARACSFSALSSFFAGGCRDRARVQEGHWNTSVQGRLTDYNRTCAWSLDYAAPGAEKDSCKIITLH